MRTSPISLPPAAVGDERGGVLFVEGAAPGRGLPMSMIVEDGKVGRLPVSHPANYTNMHEKSHPSLIGGMWSGKGSPWRLVASMAVALAFSLGLAGCNENLARYPAPTLQDAMLMEPDDGFENTATERLTNENLPEGSLETEGAQPLPVPFVPPAVMCYDVPATDPNGREPTAGKLRLPWPSSELRSLKDLTRITTTSSNSSWAVKIPAESNQRSLAHSRQYRNPHLSP